MRTSTACVACRSRRRRCDTTRFGTACKYCIARGFQCTRDTTLSPTRPTEPTDPSATLPQIAPVSTAENRPQVAVKERSTKLPPQPLCVELVHLYFDLIHDQFHSLFHRPTFLEDVIEGRVPPVILFAIMALSARFSNSPIISGIGPRDRGKEYAKESNRLLDLRDVSLTTAQACVLLGAVSITEGEPAAESVFYSTACRIASLLDLPNRASADGIDREVNIRVWWSLTMIDVWSSSGVRLPRQMVHLDNVPLPVDESLFLGLQRGQPVLPNFDVTSGPNSSLLAQMIQLNSILNQINNLNEGIVSGRISGAIQEENVIALSNKLDSWHAALPINMHDTHENLNFWASQGLGRIFVAVYLGFYHFGQLLFYQFLHENHSNVSKVQQYANKCKAHAASLCDLVYAAQATPSCEVLYTMVGHILVVASTVQIHTLLFSENEDQISTAKRRLEKNFEILSRLQSYWPTLDISFTRLRAFHQACRKSMETSFRMDQWMLRFLYEFAEPVDDKFPESASWSLENIGISPQSWHSN